MSAAFPSGVTPTTDAVLYRSWPQPDGSVRLEYLSDGAEEVMEATAGELADLFNSASLPLYGVDEATFYQQAADSLGKRSAWRAEFGYIGPRTGRRRWLRATDFPHRSADGDIYFVGVVSDLTDLHHAKVTAGRAYQTLSEHLANIPLAVIEWDEEFRVKRWSPQAEALFGWTEAEMLGRHPDDLRFIHETDHERVNGVIARMLSGVERKTVSVNRNYTKAGREVVVEWHNSVLLDPAGRLISFLSFARDLTPQFATENELAISEERLRTAMRVSNLLVWDHDRHSDELYFSDDCGLFHGVPTLPSTPSVEDTMMTVHPDDRERVRREVGAALNHARPYTVEYRGAAPGEDGQPRWFSCTGQPVLDSDGRWVRHIGVTSEITARKRGEAERHVLDQQLNEARRYESLGVLAGGIAHDFNNLLTVILGNAALARMSLPSQSPVSNPLSEIETACHRAADLCSQMTAYAGVGRMAVGPVDPAALLRQMAPLLRADATPARFALDLPPTLPAITAEPFQVRQAVRNVVTNAGEASSPDGSVRVDVLPRTVAANESGEFILPPPPGDYLVVRIADTGGGMTAEVKGKAFDPFFSTKFAGRGLGLAAVLGIVRGHRGGVRLSSLPNRGTVVELYFPRADSTDAAVLPPPPAIDDESTVAAVPPTPLTPPPADRDSDRGAILVCDDELNIRELIACLLEEQGFNVCRADNGPNGVNGFRTDPDRFVLAVVDMMMPGMDGYEVIRHVRQLRPSLPAIVISGFADRELPAELRTSGPTALLPKPFRLERLTSLVAELLNGERATS